MATKFNRDLMALFRERRESLHEDYLRQASTVRDATTAATSDKLAVDAKWRAMIDLPDAEFDAAFASLSVPVPEMGAAVHDEVKETKFRQIWAPFPTPEPMRLAGIRSALTRARESKAKATRRSTAHALLSRRLENWNRFMNAAEELAAKHGDKGTTYGDINVS